MNEERPLQTINTGRPSRLDIATLITNGVLLVGGLFYAIGTTYRSYLFSYFGLPSAALSQSLQQTMVEGYVALLTYSIVPLIGGIILILLGEFLRRKKDRLQVFYSGSFRFHYDRAKAIFMLLSAVSAGVLVGYPSANIEYSRIKRALDAGCTKCFLYVAARGQVIGMPLGQDDKTIIIATRRGVTILPTGSLKSVQPINKRELMPRWTYIPAD